MTTYPDNSPLERERLPANAEEPSIARLLGDIVGDAQLLVRKEFELARTEIKGELDKARTGAISLGIGIGIAALGGMLLILALVHGLAAAFDWPLWAAYLLVGGVLAIGGGIALYLGIQKVKQIDPVPRETIASVQKDVETIMPSDS